MELQVKLILADDEPFICGLLKKLIDFETLGLKLVACVNDGESLLEQIEALRPDIVLTDISMPKMNGLEVIRQSREKGLKCHFIIISGYRQFEYAYNALKYEVDDYILKPVEGQELNRVLQKLCASIRQSQSFRKEEKSEGLYAYLIDKAPHEELRSDALSLSEINRNFHTDFQNGLYRLLFLKLDFTRDERQIDEDVSSVINKLHELARSSFSGFCYEIVMADKRDGVMFILNYSRETENEVRGRIHSLFIEAKNVTDLFQGINLTLCVGKAVDKLNQMEEAKRSCRRASWIRMYCGLNQVIYAEQLEDAVAAGVREQLKEIGGKLEQSFVVIDKKQMNEQFRVLFHFPLSVLCSTEVMEFIRSMIGRFCEIYGKVTKEADVDRVFKTFIGRLHLQMNFKSYQEELVRLFNEHMDVMERTVSEKNARPVRQIYAYIEQHYGEHISLEDVAAVVNLSPVYLSNLFKKESGKNFTEYLTDYRMKKAKEFLRMGEKNINEIAATLGYADARYFSKVFKKEVGVKPTDYRKIYG